MGFVSWLQFLFFLSKMSSIYSPKNVLRQKCNFQPQYFVDSLVVANASFKQSCTHSSVILTVHAIVFLLLEQKICPAEPFLARRAKHSKPPEEKMERPPWSQTKSIIGFPVTGRLGRWPGELIVSLSMRSRSCSFEGVADPPLLTRRC